MRLTARYLGFKNTGTKIQEAFKSVVTGLIRKKKLESNGRLIRKR